jgi:cell filamentation protein
VRNPPKIFGDIYEWAGQIRTVAIAKGRAACSVCPPHRILISRLFRVLRSENSLQGLERRPFIDRLTYYLGKVNAVHPFRQATGGPSGPSSSSSPRTQVHS